MTRVASKGVNLTAFVRLQTALERSPTDARNQRRQRVLPYSFEVWVLRFELLCPSLWSGLNILRQYDSSSMVSLFAPVFTISSSSATCKIIPTVSGIGTGNATYTPRNLNQIGKEK